MKTKLNVMFTDNSTKQCFDFLPQINVVTDVTHADVVVVSNLTELETVHRLDTDCQYILTDCEVAKGIVEKFANTMQYPGAPTFLLPQLGQIYNKRQAENRLKGGLTAETK
jgi:hypothetical protein